MASAMEVILLERVGKLGNMGDKVRVKPGYARNYLLPQGKALRTTEKNLAYFESQKAALEKLNVERRTEAQKQAKKLDGLKVVVIRHAAEGGQLYGSVSTRDIADAVTAQSKQTVGRGQVSLNSALKSIGLFPVMVALHPEVSVEITVNIARSEDEAATQAKTGKALIAEAKGAEAQEASDNRGQFLEDSALESEREAAEAEAQEAGEDAEKAARKAARPKKAKAKKEDDAEEAE